MFVPVTLQKDGRRSSCESHGARQVCADHSGQMPVSFTPVTLKKRRSRDSDDDTEPGGRNVRPFASVSSGDAYSLPISEEQEPCKIDPKSLARSAVGITEGSNHGSSWWISKCLELPAVRRTAWVVTQALQEYADEERIATICQKETFHQRIVASGLGPILDTETSPRQRCVTISRASSSAGDMLDERAQRAMIASISLSLPTYIAGLRCWGAFMDACGRTKHFPACEADVLRYSSLFRMSSTFQTYLKHLRWGHRFLRLRNAWHSEVVRQVARGQKKLSNPPRERLALQAPRVSALIKRAASESDTELATIFAVARLFLLRVPSECLRLQWDGDHSKVELTDSTATITLTRRKSSDRPSVLVRHCCCRSSGHRLCAVHWLHQLELEQTGRSSNNLFSRSAATFVADMRRLAAEEGWQDAMTLGSHAFRRGMARDILDAGGSLATLLRAGDWRSAAFVAYLRDNQATDCAVERLAIDFSDSE